MSESSSSDERSVPNLNNHHDINGLVRHRNKPHKWTDEEREFLCVLLRWFYTIDQAHLDKIETLQILYARFSHIFFDPLSLDNDLTSNAIRRIFDQMKIDEHMIWHRVCIMVPFRNPDDHICTIQKVIAKITSVFDLQVVQRTEDPVKLMSRSPGSRSKRKQAVYDSMRYCNALSDPPNTASHIIPAEAPPIGCYSQLSHDGLHNSRDTQIIHRDSEMLPFTPEFNYKDRNGEQIIVPRCDPHRVEMYRLQASVAFRTWDNTNHGTNTPTGFYAGNFSNHFLPAPDRNSGLWAKSINVHLRPLEEPSDWISIWLTLRPAIHRLLRSDAGSMSCIDADYLAKDSTSAFPKIYSAGTAIKQYQLTRIPYPDGRPYSYRGGSEYIVWQDIEPHAIISTITKDEFEAHLNLNNDLRSALAIDELSTTSTIRKFDQRKLPPVFRNQRVGIAIGKFLRFMRMPRRFLSKTSLMIANSWGFVEGPHSCDERYLIGVWEAFDTRISLEHCALRSPIFANGKQGNSNATQTEVSHQDAHEDEYEVVENDANGEGSHTPCPVNQSTHRYYESELIPDDQPTHSSNGELSLEDWTILPNARRSPTAPKPSGKVENLLTNELLLSTTPTPLATPSPRIHNEIASIASLCSPPMTPNERRTNRFEKTLFKRHIEEHEARLAREPDPVTQLRKRIKHYHFDKNKAASLKAGDCFEGSKSRADNSNQASASKLGDSLQMPIDLDGADGDDMGNSSFVADCHILDLCGEDFEEVEAIGFQESTTPTPSTDNFALRRRNI